MSEHTITAKRQSESWVSLDTHRVEDMETWAMATAIEAACRDLSRQLIELFHQSPHDYHVKDGHFKVALETSHFHHRVMAELVLIVEEMEGP